MLKERAVEGRINEQGTRRAPLSEEQKHSNREKSRVRARVEHVFAQLTVSMKALVQRCIGLKRNAACMMLSNLTYNLLRSEQNKRLVAGCAAGGSMALP
ncbi:MAG: transposase family protein [Verrucomicrobiaceae bacterium]|nr:transposase family protein [Verrucomicrobiaceae bacterium]